MYIIDSQRFMNQWNKIDRRTKYSERFAREDGSYIDIAACARKDAPGIVAIYDYTSPEFARNYTLTIQGLLNGYTIEKDGTIIVADDGIRGMVDMADHYADDMEKQAEYRTKVKEVSNPLCGITDKSNSQIGGVIKNMDKRQKILIVDDSKFKMTVSCII